MKVERKDSSFQPVTITIETRKELAELVNTLSTGEGSEKLWSELDDILNSEGF